MGRDIVASLATVTPLYFFGFIRQLVPADSLQPLPAAVSASWRLNSRASFSVISNVSFNSSCVLSWQLTLGIFSTHPTHQLTVYHSTIERLTFKPSMRWCDLEMLVSVLYPSYTNECLVSWQGLQTRSHTQSSHCHARALVR